jgi:hypothetical protein
MRWLLESAFGMAVADEVPNLMWQRVAAQAKV